MSRVASDRLYMLTYSVAEWCSLVKPIQIRFCGDGSFSGTYIHEGIIVCRMRPCDSTVSGGLFGGWHSCYSIWLTCDLSCLLAF